MWWTRQREACGFPGCFVCRNPSRDRRDSSVRGSAWLDGAKGKVRVGQVCGAGAGLVGDRRGSNPRPDGCPSEAARPPPSTSTETDLSSEHPFFAFWNYPAHTQVGPAPA